MTKSFDQPTSRELLRYECLVQRPFGQESYLESFARDARFIETKLDGRQCGYALVQDDCIVEFFLTPYGKTRALDVMLSLVDATGAKSALCQSFDLSFKSVCDDLSWQAQAVGFLFRKFDHSLLSSRLTAQSADHSHIPDVLSIHDGFFDSEEEIRSYLEKESRLFIYRDNGNAVACGIIKQVVACRNDYDVGMVVAPNERKKGFGAQVVNHLKHYCLTQGWNPIAGCSVENLVSKRSLERAGFASEHQLIRYSSMPNLSVTRDSQANLALL